MDSPYRLGHDLGEEQDRQRHACREDTRPRPAKYQRRLCARTDRSRGVRDGVESKDRRKRAIHVLLAEPLEKRGALGMLLFLPFDIRRRDAQQDRLGDRAREREQQRNGHVGHQQNDVPARAVATDLSGATASHGDHRRTRYEKRQQCQGRQL